MSFPKINSDGSAIEPLAVEYFDTYDLDNNGADDVSYINQGLPNESSQGNTFGLATSAKRLIIGSNTWLLAHSFYDDYARVIQVQGNNHLSSIINNITTVVYDFEGRVLITKRSHNAGGTNQTTVINKTTYDVAGRPTLIYQNINGAPTDQLVAKYTYNELGQLIEKNLHESSPGQFVQSIDYRYNIRGWLSSINNAQLTNDVVTNDDTNDFFGMELLYNTADGSSMGNQPYYNGNISALKWKGFSTAPSGAAGQRSYKFNYSKVDRLLGATYQKNGGSTWNLEVGNLNETLKYDHNGNIKGLLRNQILRTNLNTTSAQAIDSLNYSYTNTTNGNRLTKVEDAVADTTLGGFINRATATNEFTYAKDGSMTADGNKKISSIVYNILGKPSQIIFSNGRRIDYTYDAAGSKLTMKTYKSNVLQTSTDYVDGFVYENLALSFMSSPEGRVVKNGSAFEYQYAIADHQGNTRVVFSSVTPTASSYTTGFEEYTHTADSITFQNYPTGAKRSSNDLFDHTDFAGTVYTRSNFLNGGYNSQVGLSKSIKVYPGDVIHAEVNAKYWNQTSTNSNLAAFASALTAAFGVSAGSVGEGLKAYNALNNFGAGIVAAGGSGNTLGPKAFITVLLYDKNYKFVDVTYKQISPSALQTGTSTKAAFDLMTVDKTVVEPGYAFIYISNEDPHLVDVYFDDLTITQTKTKVIQYNEYYPFGLQTQNSWTRENSTGNNFLANGATELNLTSSLYDLTYRNYDPILGRFGQVDPLADMYGSHSPYNYALNAPSFRNDPNGDQVGDNCTECGSMYGALYSSQWSRNPFTGRPARMDDGWNPNFKGPVWFNDHFALPTMIEWALGKQPEAPTAQDMGAVNLQIFGNNKGGVGNRRLANYNFSTTLTFVELDENGNPFVPYTNTSFWTYLKAKNQQKANSTTGGIWDSKLMRGFIGDYLYFSVDLSIFVGAGVKETPLGYVMPLRGKDAFTINSFSDTGAGVGLEASGSLNLGRAHMLGSASQVTAQNFGGKRLSWDVGVAFVGAGGFLSPGNGTSTLGVIGTSVSFSLGAPWFNGNVNYGETLIEK